MSELPRGWAYACLPELISSDGVFVDGDWVESKDQDPDGNVRLIQLADIGDGRYLDKSNRFLNQSKAIELGCTFLKRGDVLVARMPDPLGRACIFLDDRKQAVTVVDVCVIRGWLEHFDHTWLMHFINSPSFRADIHSLQSGSTRKRISRGNLSTLKLPVPPRAEQTRIVAKLEELLSDLDAGVTELKAAQKKLGQYRQSLLKAAVEGALTAEWREEQGKRHSTPLSPRGRGAGGEGIQALNTSDAIWFRDRARQLRKEQTPMEQWLWQLLRAKRFSGFKFRRQQTIGRYIVDFVCFAQKLIIELDGSQHADAQEEDAARDYWLRGEGFRVLRFWNNELQQQTDAVLEMIWNALQEFQEPPLPNPSPTRGEGLNASIFLNGGGVGGEGETGAQLLERILTERRHRWEAKQLAKFKEQGKTPPKDWQKKYPEPVQPDTSGLPELPEGWVWASVDQVAEVFLGKMLDKTKHISGQKMPYLRNVNVRWGSIDTEDLSEMFFDNDEHERYGLTAGDVLVCEGGEPGRAAVCKQEHETLKYQKALHRVRLFGLYEPDLLVAFLEHAAKTGKLDKAFTGSTINHFTKESFLVLCIPLAPLEEQKVIVEGLSSAFIHIGDQVSYIDLSLKQSAAQRQNILRAAFSGELVPQDPNDEPASVLLERIHAERVERNVLKKPRGRKIKETS